MRPAADAQRTLRNHQSITFIRMSSGLIPCMFSCCYRWVTFLSVAHYIEIEIIVRIPLFLSPNFDTLLSLFRLASENVQIDESG